MDSSEFNADKTLASCFRFFLRLVSCDCPIIVYKDEIGL